MAESTVHFSGEVEAVLFRKEEDDWSVLRVICDETRESRMVVGFSGCQPGQLIEADGEWKAHQRYGLQFVAERILALYPTTETGLAAYIGSGALPGVGPALAKQLVGHFGMDLPSILDASPERIREIKGVGPSKAARVITAWKSQASIRDIMLFLHSQGLPSSLCRRIHKALGDDAIKTIKENPYLLCLEVRGIGFKTADGIARNLSIPANSEQRVRAGLVHHMGELTGVGHCGCQRERFVVSCAKMLEVGTARVAEVLDLMLAETATLSSDDRGEGEFIQHEDVVYPIGLAIAEEIIARELIELAKSTPPHARRVDDALIAWAADTCGMKLANKQGQAVHMGLTQQVAVITGGPGCGKTATLKVLLAAFRRLKLSVALAAPTGKAAQRAREATGMDALTIHRLLGIRAGGDSDDAVVHADVLVIDEMSMVDVPLMYRVVRALKPTTTLVMVGDVDQLPSVGPGQVLADVIHSQAVPVTVLDEVFRQAAGSAIITNAHAINRGENPVSAGPKGDFFVLTEQNTRPIAIASQVAEDERPAAVAEAVAAEIESLVTRRLPATYQVDPIRDIQVLAPMNKGGCGVQELNRRLQRVLNPDPAQYIQRRGYRYGIGDKVIQRKNNYDLEIFNGDVGFVEAVSDKDEVLCVRFDGRTVSIPFEDLGDLDLAYAVTIHKSQGSQAPVAIIPMVTQHWVMLQRNLLYTGVTRAARLTIVIGQTRAIQAAVKTVTSTQRVTRLRSLLAEAAA